MCISQRRGVLALYPAPDRRLRQPEVRRDVWWSAEATLGVATGVILCHASAEESILRARNERHPIEGGIMRRALLWTAVIALALIETGCIVVRANRCTRGRVFRAGVCVCPAPNAWSAAQRRCVRPLARVRCGAGFAWSAAARRCVRPVVVRPGVRPVVRPVVRGVRACGAGMVWSPAMRRCVRPAVARPVVRRACGAGFVWNAGARRCVRPVVVRPGVRPVVRRAAPVARCPAAGMVRVAGRCRCPKPTVFNARQRRCVGAARRVRVRRIVR